MRIDKFLVHLGLATRKEARQYVKEKRVQVNGVTVKKSEEKIRPESDEVFLDGKLLEYKEYTYVMLHKPQGVITATEDFRKNTVMELLLPQYQKLFPVGRLDKDTEGLLLLTNHGDLAHRLLSPKKHVEKEYFAYLDQDVFKEDKEKIEKGIEIDGGEICLPAQLEKLPVVFLKNLPLEERQKLDVKDTIFEKNTDSSTLPLYPVKLILHEGKYHQVKRMFAACGKKVMYLKRLRMASLSLDETLACGASRELTEEEREKLLCF